MITLVLLYNLFIFYIIPQRKTIIVIKIFLIKRSVILFLKTKYIKIKE